MLDFHYDIVKEKYPGSKSKLAFTDTDSLLYEIETDDIYADMWRIANILIFLTTRTIIRDSATTLQTP